MLMPKKVKYRKQQRGRMRGKAWRGSDVSFGDYSLKALGLLADGSTDRSGARGDDPLHKARRQGLGAGFTDKPITKKPQETRMGKGKGAPEGWVCVVRPSHILFEMNGVPAAEARRAFQLASAKLPIKTRFATRFAEEAVS